FKRDTISLKGTFRTLAATNKVDSIEIQAAKITYQSGVSVLWNGTLANGRLNSDDQAEDLKTISGTLGGTTPEGYAFVANITDKIIYNYDCKGSGELIPVQGTLTMRV